MDEVKKRNILRTGRWIAGLVGCSWGLFLQIGGYLADWGPGGGMAGPTWLILLTGIVCILVGAYIGQLIIKKLAGKILNHESSAITASLVLFIIMSLASMAAFIAGWELGFLLGKLTGTITGLEWKVVLFSVPIMSFIYGIPVSLGVGLLYGIVAFFVLKR
jgi:uncharacterized membrane protein (Fun14 family)